jgi:transposase-like protein
MSGSMSDQQQAKKLYLDDGLTMDAIAQKLGVSRRTVERWSASDPEGKWTDLKLAQKVVSFVRPDSAEHSRPVERRDEPVKVRPRRQRGQVDELEIVESAIVNLDLLLGCMCGASGDDRPVDTRGVGTTAGALVKLLEYRRKVQPPTAAELAEQVLALNINPAEFAQELKRAWQLRA